MLREDTMDRSKLLAALVMLGLLIGWTAHGPAKDKKDPPPVKLPEPDTLKDDLRVVNENGFKGDGPDLVEYFHKKTLKQPELKEISALIKLLGDDDFSAREDAFKSLVGMGATKNM